MCNVLILNKFLHLTWWNHTFLIDIIKHRDAFALQCFKEKSLHLLQYCLTLYVLVFYVDNLLLQTVWIQIRPDIWSGLIWIQTGWRSDNVLERIFLKKLILKKITDDKKIMKIFPACKKWSCFFLHMCRGSSAPGQAHLNPIPIWNFVIIRTLWLGIPCLMPVFLCNYDWAFLFAYIVT